MAQLIGPADLIAVSWENFRKNFRIYIEMILWVVVLSVLQWTILVLLQAVTQNKLEQLLLFTILSIPASLVFLAITATMIDITAKGLGGKFIDARESLHHGFHCLLSLLWVSILTSIIIFGGLILLVIPALIFFIWIKFAPYHTVLDNTGGTAAIKASYKLVTGRWWSVFWRAIIPLLFFSLAASLVDSFVYLILGGIFGDVRMFFGTVPDINQLSRTHTLITAIVPQITRWTALALILGADIALWFDLKKKG
jgi:hypothetical protein